MVDPPDKDGEPMADSIVLSVSEMQTVLDLQRLADQRSRATGRLSSGRRIDRITDGPRDYLRASALANRASDLVAAKAGIGQAIESLAAAGTGLDAVRKLGEQMKGLVLTAQSTDADGRAELAARFDTVRRQMDLLVADVSYQGANLLDDPAGSLKVPLSDRADSTLVVEGQASDVATLGIGDAAAYNGFVSAADIETALAAVDGALSTLRGAASRTSADTAILKVREDFAGNLAGTLQAGAAKLTEADLNAEGARLLTVQTRDALAHQGLRITAQSHSQLAALLGG